MGNDGANQKEQTLEDRVDADLNQRGISKGDIPTDVYPYIVALYGKAERLATENEKLEELALVDPLTGAFNRRRLDQDLENLLESNHQGHRPTDPHGITYIRIDIDDFKDYNDAHGHEVGDKALKAIADAIRRSTGQEGYRFSGGSDEFAAIVYTTDKECHDPEAYGRIIAESLVSMVREMHVENGAGEGVPLRISVGATYIPPNTLALPDIVDREADSAAYAAKSTGDRFVHYKDIPSPQ